MSQGGFWMPNQGRAAHPQYQQQPPSLPAMGSDIDYRRLAMGPPPQAEPQSWRNPPNTNNLPSRDPMRITIANEARFAAQPQQSKQMPPPAAPQMNWQRADEILRMAEEPESLQITIGNELASGKEKQGSSGGGIDLLGDDGDLGSLLEQLADYSNTYEAAETEIIEQAKSQLSGGLASQASAPQSDYGRDRPTPVYSSSGAQDLRYQQEQQALKAKYQEQMSSASGMLSRNLGVSSNSSYQPVSLASLVSSLAGTHTPTMSGGSHWSGSIASSAPSTNQGSQSQPNSGQLTHAEQMALYERFTEASPAIQRSFLSENVPPRTQQQAPLHSMSISPPAVRQQQEIAPSSRPAPEPEISEQDKIKKVLESMGFNFNLSQKMQQLAEMTRKKEQELLEKRQKEQQMKLAMPPSQQGAIGESSRQMMQNPPPGYPSTAYPPPSVHQAPIQIPGVSPTHLPPPRMQEGANLDGGKPVITLDSEWERATRQFAEDMKQRSGRKQRSSRSSSSSSLGSRGRSRRRSRSKSVKKAAKKKAEEERKMKEKEEKARKAREEKERKAKEEKERKAKEEERKAKEEKEKKEAEEEKKLLKVQLEAEAQQLIEKMKDMREKQGQHDKKMILLRGELDRLKRQHGELCRKVQRTKDGHNDPLLMENARLQTAIVKQLNQIQVATDEFEKEATNGQTRVGQIREQLKEFAAEEEAKNKLLKKSDKSLKMKRKSKDRDSSEESKKKDKKKSSKKGTKGSPENKIYFAFFDAGSHWCNLCNVTCSTIFDMFQHFHGEAHKNKLDLTNAPWVPESVKDPSKKEAPKNVSIAIEPIKGVEFMIPAATALYCDLCKVFVGNYLCAEEHVRSQEHGTNYRAHIELHPLYERTIAMSKTGGLQQSRADGGKPTSGSAIFQEIATKDIKVTVKNTEAMKQTPQPGFGLLGPASKQDNRSVLNDGSNMQIKITQSTQNGAQKKTKGSYVTSSEHSSGNAAKKRSFNENKDSPSKRSRRSRSGSRSRSRSRSRSPPRAYNSRRSESPGREGRRSVSPPRRRRRGRRGARSRSRESRRHRSRSRELPYKAPPTGTRHTALSAYEQRQKALREEEETRLKERQDIIEQAKKKNQQLIQSQRVAEAIKRQMEGRANPEDLTVLATYGKQDLLKRQGTMKAAAGKPPLIEVKGPGWKPNVPPPSEFLERFKSATKHIGVVKPAATATTGNEPIFITDEPSGNSATTNPQSKVGSNPVPAAPRSFWGPTPSQVAINKQKQEAAEAQKKKETEAAKSEEKKSTGGTEEEWHLSLPDTAGDQTPAKKPAAQKATGVGGSSTEKEKEAKKEDNNLDDLTELADLADQVVKDMNDKKEGSKGAEEDDFKISFDDLEVVDQL